MATTLEAALLITARDRTGPGLRSAEANVRSAVAGMGRAAIGLGAGLIGFETLRRGAIAIGTAAVETDRQLTGLRVTAGATAAEIDSAWRLLSLSAGQTNTSTRDLTESTSALVQAGLALDASARSAPTVALAAKASGAAMADMSDTAVSLLQNLGATPETLERFFDIAIKGGKAGRFELKNMAAEIPALAASAQQVGLVGEAGFARLVAMLQIERQFAGSGAQAANNLRNMLDKMVSPTTIKNLKSFGVDWTREMRKARKEGKDLTETFVDMVAKVTKGDATAISEILPDSEARTGLLALVSSRKEYAALVAGLRQSLGETRKDFDSMTQGAAAGIDRLAASWQNFLDVMANRTKPAVEAATSALSTGLDTVTIAQTLEQSFAKTFEKFAGRAPTFAETLLGPAATDISNLGAKVLGRELTAADAERAIQDSAMTAGAGAALKEGRITIDQYQAVVEGPERRQAARDRSRGFHASRGGDRTDEQLAQEAEAKRAEWIAVRQEANNPAIGGMARNAAKELLPQLENELTVLRGYIRAREYDANRKGPVLPQPRPETIDYKQSAAQAAIDNATRNRLAEPSSAPTAAQAAIDRANRFRPVPRVKDDAVAPGRPRDVLPGFDMAFDAPAVAGPNRPRRPARGFDLAYGPEDLPTAAVGKSALQLAGVFDEATGIIATATSALSKFRPPTQKETWGLKEPWPMEEKPGGGYRSRITPGGTPMTFNDGGSNDGAVDDLGAKLKSAGDAFISALQSPGTLVAKVTEPVKAQLEGRASVDVRVAVTGGQVVSARSSSSGHIQTNVGTSMPHLNRRPDRRDE